jgi:hypothetical protein
MLMCVRGIRKVGIMLMCVRGVGKVSCHVNVC